MSWSLRRCVFLGSLYEQWSNKSFDCDVATCKLAIRVISGQVNMTVHYPDIGHISTRGMAETHSCIHRCPLPTWCHVLLRRGFPWRVHIPKELKWELALPYTSYVPVANYTLHGPCNTWYCNKLVRFVRERCVRIQGNAVFLSPQELFSRIIIGWAEERQYVTLQTITGLLQGVCDPWVSLWESLGKALLSSNTRISAPCKNPKHEVITSVPETPNLVRVMALFV